MNGLKNKAKIWGKKKMHPNRARPKIRTTLGKASAQRNFEDAKHQNWAPGRLFVGSSRRDIQQIGRRLDDLAIERARHK